MKKRYNLLMVLALIMLVSATGLAQQTPFELNSVLNDYLNIRNKAQDTYMRPQDGAPNRKIHQWETDFTSAGTFSSYQWELRPATIDGYYYFVNKSTGQIHKPTGESTGDASLDASFTLDATTKDNDFFMYAIEEVTGDANYYHIKNKGSGYYIRPNGGGDAPSGGTKNDVQIRHQSATLPTFNSYRWYFVPRTEAGTLPPHIWNGTAWDKIVAPRLNNVQISGNYSLSTDGSFESNHLTIDGAAILTVEAGETLVVHGDLTNNGSIVVESGGSLITKGAITGSGFTISRETTFNSSTGKYSIIGSPVMGATTSVLGSLVYSYDETVAYGSGSTERFSEVISPVSMNAGDAFFSAFTGTVSFTGTPNTGQIDVSLIYNNTQDGGNAGFNLVSNPYPAAIGYDEFMALNATTNSTISGTIYLWDDGGSDGSQRTNGDYITANSMGSAAAGSGRSADWNGHIGSAQGFFVKATQVGTLSFTDDMKVEGNNEDAAYFRNQNPNSSPFSTAKLTLTNLSSNVSVETLIGFAEDATTNVDRLYDADMIGGNNGVRFYSLIETNPYTIQGIPLGTEVISLGMQVDGANQEYSIDLSGLNNWTKDSPIYLYDRYNSNYTELTTDSYTFSSISGSFNDRFELHFRATEILNVLDEKKVFTSKYSREGIAITSGKENVSVNVLIHDLTGRILHQEGIPSTTDALIKFPFNQGQVYLIKYAYKDVVYTDKISFN